MFCRFLDWPVRVKIAVLVAMLPAYDVGNPLILKFSNLLHPGTL